MTGMRWAEVRSAAAATVVTAISMQRSRSCWVSVGDSPVVPTGTRPSMPDAICHATRRAVGGLVERAVGGERGDEGGEGAAEAGGVRVIVRCSLGVGLGGWGWPGQAGTATGGGREEVVHDGVERVEPGGARLPDQPAGGREGAVGIGGAVPGGEPQLHGLARAVEGHEVGARRRAGPDAGDLEGRAGVVGGVVASPRPGRPSAGPPRRSAVRWRVPCPTAGRPCRGDATPRWTARNRRRVRTSRPRSRRA